MAPTIPLMFVGIALANAGFPPAIISALVLSLNGAFYAGIGWLSWPVAKLLSKRKSDRKIRAMNRILE